VSSVDRSARRHCASDGDQRSPFQRDRDRILYSTSFRRLDGVTQIVRAGEADVFHNRLTHSIKVAQVGRRLSEHCIREQREAAEFHGLDVEVVEAACLAHDLGHPPFGHVGEETLDDILTRNNEVGVCLDAEGFEGNAQSFRIVTKLAIRFPQCGGLDLTRATMAALLKYPWARDTSEEGAFAGKAKKWGYYLSEQDDFDFCREGLDPDKRTLEAELMDWADDIAYSVHDLEDFHRCNAIPWSRIIGIDAPDVEKIIDNASRKWHGAPKDAKGRLREAHRRLTSIFEGFRATILSGAYEGTQAQRLAIRSLTSTLIGRYIQATKLVEAKDYSAGNSRISLDNKFEDEVKLLKQIARDYILSSPSLAAQQLGQRRVLESLFNDFLGEIEERKPKVLPRRFHHLIEENGLSPARIAADCVASLSEGEAIALHQRLTGISSGSVLDPIVR
jgi:dGTPase